MAAVLAVLLVIILGFLLVTGLLRVASELVEGRTLR